VLALLLAGAFFVPWVNITYDYAPTTAFSPWCLAIDAGFPYYNSHPVVFILLAIPLALLVLSFTKLSYKKMLTLAAAGVLVVTIFNIYFAHGLDYRQYVAPAGFFWLMLVVYGALMVALLYGMIYNKEMTVPENVLPSYSRHQKMATAAIMLSLAIIIHLYASYTFYLGGAPMLRISFAGIFNNTTAILFGPFFGGVQRLLHDMAGHFLRPQGAFLWPITLVAFMRGAATGWMWLRVRNVRPGVYSRAYTAVFAALLVFGIVNLFVQLLWPESAYVVAMTPRENNIIVHFIASWGLIITGIVGLVPQFVVYKLTRKNNDNFFYGRFIKFFAAVMIPGLLFNSLNTVVLFFTVVGPVTIGRGFLYFWVPRFFEELLTGTVIVYVMVILLTAYEKALGRKIVQKT